MTKKAFLALAVFAGIQAQASAAVRQVDVTTKHRIDHDVRALLKRYDVAGAAIAVLRDGRVVYTRAYGQRDRARNLPVQLETAFEIGSITKQFTAAAVMQLQQAGKLDIDQPLATYLPDAAHARDITLRQMLSHTSGLHDYFDGPDQEIDALSARPIAFDDLMARSAAKPLDFPPGSRWAYSNTGYRLLEKVIERVSGERYRDYVQHHFFDPLGMAHSTTVAEEAGIANRALGYRHEDGRLVPAPYFHVDWSGGAGFIVSTLADLAKWDEALQGGKVVSPASYAEMTKSVVLTDGSPAGYGLGLFVDSAFDQPRIGHTGGAQGFTTADEYFPGQDVRILAFTNSGDKNPEAGEILTNAIFAELYPKLAAAAEKPVVGEDKAVTASASAAFLQLQSGAGYDGFGEPLGGKLTAGLGTKFVRQLGPYGKPTGFIFKGKREGVWSDYLVKFGPGFSLKYGVRTDAAGKVIGVSLG